MNKGWYPENKDELNNILEGFLSQDNKINAKEIHGIIVPHAGYAYSGKIAGKAFSLLKKQTKHKRAIVFGPSHYTGFYGVATLGSIKTPLGEIKISKNNMQPLDYEHSIENQIPFLQKLGFKEVLPVIVGQISERDAEGFAQEFLKYKDVVFIFSTDLSHFQPYNHAVKKDKETIRIIEDLDFEKINNLDACGIHPLMILMNMCKINNWKPKLIEYKNSGDVTGDKSSRVVGYGAFWF
ncbi:MAG: AmmeMemoRadiSam system protein B [Candidatus Pacearchaeota archaeon]|jgi:hypothetical protein